MKQQEAYHAGTEYQFVKPILMGNWTSYSLLNDPIHILFVLSRYKFCARMLRGKKNVLEVGCGDAPGTPIVAQFVNHVLALDIEKKHILLNKKRLKGIKNIDFIHLDICKEIPKGRFDASFSIDVIEHLDKDLNKPFMENQVKCLTEDGICIIGTPNKDATRYATHRSKVQHINLHDQRTLKERMEKYFRNVFMFSMNDETLHTGYEHMSHYIFAMGVGKK